MLKEFKDISQEKTGYRKLFFDEKFELYIWYSMEGGDIIGFQLCYDRINNEHCLTWMKDKGYLHSKIDDGEKVPGKAKQSPILTMDGSFNKEDIARAFKAASKKMGKEERTLVHQKILEFDPKLINQFM